MANEKANDAASTLPLFRVNFSYTAGHNLRSGTYVLPAKTASDAGTAAQALLTARFLNTDTRYKIGKIVTF